MFIFGFVSREGNVKIASPTWMSNYSGNLYTTFTDKVTNSTDVAYYIGVGIDSEGYYALTHDDFNTDAKTTISHGIGKYSCEYLLPFDLEYTWAIVCYTYKVCYDLDGNKIVVYNSNEGYMFTFAGVTTTGTYKITSLPDVSNNKEISIAISLKSV